MKKRVASGLMLFCAIALALLIAFSDTIVTLFDEVPNLPRVIYWAHGNLSDTDDIPEKDAEYYFGWNRYRGGEEAVKAGEAKNIMEFIVTDDGGGDFFYSLYHDPALTAATALYLDQLGLTKGNPILEPEKDLLVGQRADAAHLRYLQHEDQWDEAIERIKGILLADGVEREIKQLNGYTSAMYQVPNQLEGDKPGVVVRNTRNAGGHFIVFKVPFAGKVIQVRFRLECGYQGIDVPNWPVPEAKDPMDDLQHNPEASNYDFYSPSLINHDPDKTETEEPFGPDKYEAPEPSVTYVTPPPEQETDHGDGKTETVGGQEYVVETGDQGLTPLEDIAESGKVPVETALQGDNTVTTAVTDFE